YQTMSNETNTGSDNSAWGINTLNNNTSGARNIAIGAYAGKYNSTASDQLFVNSTDRTNYTGDTTNSLLYGQQTTSMWTQFLRVNGELVLNANTSDPYLAM